jgi:pyruvate formate lyase activating enzyme
MDLAPVLEFARRLASRQRTVWLRYVLVPSLTDKAEDIAQLAGFAANLGNIQRVDILPFHQLGKFKWKELKLQYVLKELEPPSAELVRFSREEFRACGLNAF